MSSPTVSRLISAFLKWANAALAPATVAAYRHQLRKVPPRLKRKPAARCRKIDLTAWAKTWHEAQALVRVFNWAVDDARLLRCNPLRRCRLPGRGRRRRIIASAVLRRMMRTGRLSSRHFLLALRETLARPQEIRAAAWEQLESQEPELSLDEALRLGRAVIVQPEFKDVRRRRDQSLPRVLIVSRRLGRLIVRLASRLSGPRTGPIFRNNRGKPWTKDAVRCLMRRLRRRLNIAADARGENVTAYTVRHSLATLAASRGVTDRTLADLLGHVESRTTSRYLHLQVDHLRAAMARFAPDRPSVRQAVIQTL